MKPALAIAVVAIALGAAACSDKPEPPVTSAVPTMQPTTPPANNPQGDLTRAEENTAMPKAGQANNHSSPAFDPGKAEPKS